MTAPDTPFAYYTPPPGYSVEQQYKDGAVAFVLRRVSDKYTVGIYDNINDIARSANADLFEQNRQALRQPIEDLADDKPGVDYLTGGPRLDFPV